MKGSDLFPVEDHIPEEMCKSYNRTEETLVLDVKTIKEWMKTQKHLPEILDDVRIRNFLLLNKCSVEKTKQKIDMYYTIRSLIPEVYEKSHPKYYRMKLVMEIVYLIALPKLTEDMYRVVILKVRNKDLIDKLYPQDIAAYALNLHEIRMKEDYTFGDVIIFDMKDMDWGVLVKFTPIVVAKLVAIYEKVYSVRVKAMYVINSKSFVNKFLAIGKAVIKPKLFQRIHVCDDIENVYEILPRNYFPRDYGGMEKSFEEFREMIQLKLNEYTKRFDKLDEIKVNENLRPSKLRNDEILGFYGNFKKIDVD